MLVFNPSGRPHLHRKKPELAIIGLKCGEDLLTTTTVLMEESARL
jgi:hypothetical protein